MRSRPLPDPALLKSPDADRLGCWPRCDERNVACSARCCAPGEANSKSPPQRQDQCRQLRNCAVAAKVNDLVGEAAVFAIVIPLTDAPGGCGGRIFVCP